MPYEVVIKHAIEADLIPVSLVPVPGSFYLWMLAAPIDGEVWVALQGKILWTLQVDACEYLIQHTHHKGGLIKGEIFRCQRQRQAIVSCSLYIHELYPFVLRMAGRITTWHGGSQFLHVIAHGFELHGGSHQVHLMQSVDKRMKRLGRAWLKALVAKEIVCA